MMGKELVGIVYRVADVHLTRLYTINRSMYNDGYSDESKRIAA